MATVKVRFNKVAASTIRYVLEHGRPGDPVDGEHCIPDGGTLAAQFKAVRDAYGFKGGNEAMHIIQSWSPDESAKFDPAMFNELGRELATRQFPGHQVLVVTHTDRAHVHNHIVVNTVHTETGARIHNKFHHLHDLRTANDKICLDRGLTIPNQQAKGREARMPDKVQRMVRFHRFSYLMDMKQKADFARAYATSYDEYGGILGELGVTARIEAKNITYFYPGQARGKRGKNLGVAYDKSGLEKAFKANDDMFQSVPGLRAKLRGQIEQFKLVGGDQASVQRKDYGKFTRVPRREDPTGASVHRDLSLSMLPVDEIARARQTNIIDYCRRKRIAVSKGEDGAYRLKDREHVVLREFQWTNTKNGTTGSLIDLVAAHKNLTFLQSIAEINGNPRLLLLEQHFGTQRRNYTSFYVPDSERASGPPAVKRLSEFLGAHGARPELSETLLRNHPVHVGKSGVIHLFGKDDDGGVVEYSQDAARKWRRSDRGEIRTPFLSVTGRGHKAVIFSDPLSFLAKASKDTLAGRKAADSVLVLLSSDSRAVDLFLADHKHVNQIELVQAKAGTPTQPELDFFNTLKGRYRHLEIGIEFAGPGRTLHGRGHDISLF